MKRTLLLTTLIIVGSGCQQDAQPTATRTGTRVVVPVNGIHCGSCEQAITNSAMECTGVNAAEADSETGELVLWLDPDGSKEVVLAKIEPLGFTRADTPE